MGLWGQGWVRPTGGSHDKICLRCTNDHQHRWTQPATTAVLTDTGSERKLEEIQMTGKSFEPGWDNITYMSEPGSMSRKNSSNNRLPTEFRYLCEIQETWIGYSVYRKMISGCGGLSDAQGTCIKTSHIQNDNQTYTDKHEYGPHIRFEKCTLTGAPWSKQPSMQAVSRTCARE